MTITAPVLTEGHDYHVIAGKMALTVDGKTKLLEAAGYSLAVDQLPGYQVKITLAQWHTETVYRGWLTLEEVPIGERLQGAWKTHPSPMLRARAISKLFELILKDDARLLTLATNALPIPQAKKS